MTKIKTRLPTQLTAAEFRAGYVDQEEHGLQARCVKWFRKAYPQLLIAAIPNAAKRSPQLANMMLAEGLLTGFPDLVMPFPSREYHGLFIEMKTMKKGSKLSTAQILIHAQLRAQGNEVIIPRTFEEFQQQVNEYLQS